MIDMNKNPIKSFEKKIEPRRIFDLQKTLFTSMKLNYDKRLLLPKTFVSKKFQKYGKWTLKTFKFALRGHCPFKNIQASSQ